jgi:hypothetical protein
MKIPSKIILCGHDWTIYQKKGMNGGFFDGKKKVIHIQKDRDNQDKAEILLHEILEAILTIRGHRFSHWLGGDDDTSQDLLYKFVFNHSEFTNIIYDLKLALNSCLK